MKIIVLHEDQSIADIDIIEPLTLKEGLGLNTIIDASGIEYFFTKDGYYDGSGRMVIGL